MASSYSEKQPDSGTPYLCAEWNSAELECLLTRLGCSIKDGSDLMNSAAQLFHNRAIGVIMTGMGSDGASGMAAIHREGGLTIGQDEASCAVYGMPKVCAELGVLSRILPLSHIPYYLISTTRHFGRADLEAMRHPHS